MIEELEYTIPCCWTDCECTAEHAVYAEFIATEEQHFLVCPAHRGQIFESFGGWDQILTIEELKL